jgi:oligoribonuclease NrnB/cAMP/cGMP phosphodiesterase (DHH superfamily)|tara:strand:+ start:497 stop:1477 length:981 start_codon:yes stop_codon:yes gene_type:complete
MTDVDAFPEIHRIVADSDLDGMCAAAVLLKAYPEAEVVFGHAAILRAGMLDDVIDSKTVTVDLPFHPKSGWYLDHHLTNKPNQKEEQDFTQRGGIVHWEHTPSAARLAYELFKNRFDLTHLEEIMPMVDALDSGGISREDFLEDGPVLQLSRTLSSTDDAYMQHLLRLFTKSTELADITSDVLVYERMKAAQEQRIIAVKIVQEKTVIIDRLAICRLDDSGIRSNGYLITAHVGDKADACCVVHGYSDGDLSTPERPPLSASFYANSFIKDGQNRYDLSKLATAFDPHGGGHANACGCRIQSPGLDSNLNDWIQMWNDRENVLRIN